MKFVSTRGQAPVLGFNDVLLAALARDGGLYVPQTWPKLDKSTIASMAGKPYADVAKTVLWPFVKDDIAKSDFDKMVEEAYATFRHDDVTPLVQVAPNHYILELFHGPTMAFKDVAMQLLSRLMNHVLKERGENATIIGATSGDTGGAAIEAFKGKDNTNMFILFPNGRVSDVQRMQMTTVKDKSIHALAVDGNFDDCQALVKALFNDHSFRDEVQLSGVNSINWARIMAQVVYYFTAAVALGGPTKKVSFTVPTGNFGDIFAGFVAKRMGLPIEQLVIATNSNDILTRCLETMRYEVTGVAPTTSPSMDIQVSSNFERLLFEAHDRDGEEVSRLMDGLEKSGSFSINLNAFEKIKAEFDAGRSSAQETKDTIKTTLEQSGYLLDPHTAVGLKVAKEFAQAGTPMVTLATAHPAKFPDAVKDASGIHPALPSWQGDLMKRKEHFSVIANDAEALKAHIRKHI
ncbi:MAG: threonine synthase [Hyphomicrobiales bacterium]|nr:threonine synthase [Hyphomicrobiales bacterium]PCH50254.1 MAG: threonine synthase [Hyphomicrobiales bacterium]